MCHIEKHVEPHEKDPDASLIGSCVLDNYGVEDEDECSDGCCCFTETMHPHSTEECRRYQLDNFTLTALVESGDEEYQHLQNSTGHWVTTAWSKSALRSRGFCGHPSMWPSWATAPESSPRRVAEDPYLYRDGGNTLEPGPSPNSTDCL